MGGPADPVKADPSTADVGTHLMQKEAIAAWMQDIAPFAILTTDAQLRITGWNQWMVTHSSLQPEEVIGRPLFEIFPDIERRKLHDYFGRALAGEVSVLSAALHRYLVPMPKTVKESSEAHMLQTVRIAPLHAGREILGTITIIEDVSQREFQAEVLRRQHSRDKLLSWALAGLLQAHDPAQEIRTLVPKVTDDLGLEACFAHFQVSGLPDLEHPPASGGRTATLAALALYLASLGGDLKRVLTADKIQQGSDSVYAGLRAAGVQACAVFPLLIADRLLGVIGFASVRRDAISPADLELLSTLSQYLAIAIDRSMTENNLRNAEKTIRDYADELETTVTERTAQLYETIAQLQSFSYSVAHDLRAPIRALKGYCDILEEDHGPTMAADGLDMIHKLSRSANRLDILTRDLLKFSQVSLQDVRLESVNLSELVHDILALTPSLQNGVLKIEEPLGTILGQPTLVHQCLSNILDNAIKFSRPGEVPSIRVRVETVGADHIVRPNSKGPFNPATHAPFAASGALTELKNVRRRVWIEDKGIGIPAEAHEKIFGIFERIADPGAPEGTGIGLAIVARAMQQMGGSCGVESTPGNGSRFWLEFREARTS